MIDLHCHILPFVDDGSGSMEESLEMARIAVNDGIEAIVATPHWTVGVYSFSTSWLESRVDNLNNELKRSAIPLTIYPGSEIQLEPGITKRLRTSRLTTINNSRYVLIELPSVFLTAPIKNELYDLLINGFVPIIAHPERHAEIRKNPEFLEDLIEMGCLGQVTAESITGGFGRHLEAIAGQLVKNRLVQIVASDAHSKNWRPPVLSEAIEKIARLLGNSEEAEKMATETPQAILADKDIIFSGYRPGKEVPYENYSVKRGNGITGFASHLNWFQNRI